MGLFLACVCQFALPFTQCLSLGLYSRAYCSVCFNCWYIHAEFVDVKECVVTVPSLKLVYIDIARVFFKGTLKNKGTLIK